MDETNSVGTGVKPPSKKFMKAKNRLLKMVPNVGEDVEELVRAGSYATRDLSNIRRLVEKGIDPQEAVRKIFTLKPRGARVYKIIQKNYKMQSKQARLEERIIRQTFNFQEQFQELGAAQKKRVMWLLDKGFTEREAIALASKPIDDTAEGNSWELGPVPIPVRVVHTKYPRKALTLAEVDKVKDLIASTIVRMKSAGAALEPQLGDQIAVGGYLLVVCFDQPTVYWVDHRMHKVPWKRFLLRTITDKDQIKSIVQSSESEKQTARADTLLSPSSHSVVGNIKFPQREKDNQRSGKNVKQYKVGRGAGQLHNAYSRRNNPKPDERFENNERSRSINRHPFEEANNRPQRRQQSNDRFTGNDQNQLNDDRFAGPSSGEKRNLALQSEVNYRNPIDSFGRDERNRSSDRGHGKFTRMSADNNTEHDLYNRSGPSRFRDNQGLPSSRSELKYDDCHSDRNDRSTADYGGQSYERRDEKFRSIVDQLNDIVKYTAKQFVDDPYNRRDLSNDLFRYNERTHAQDRGYDEFARMSDRVLSVGGNEGGQSYDRRCEGPRSAVDQIAVNREFNDGLSRDEGRSGRLVQESVLLKYAVKRFDDDPYNRRDQCISNDLFRENNRSHSRDRGYDEFARMSDRVRTVGGNEGGQSFDRRCGEFRSAVDQIDDDFKGDERRYGGLVEKADRVKYAINQFNDDPYNRLDQRTSNALFRDNERTHAQDRVNDEFARTSDRVRNVGGNEGGISYDHRSEGLRSAVDQIDYNRKFNDDFRGDESRYGGLKAAMAVQFDEDHRGQPTANDFFRDNERSHSRDRGYECFTRTSDREHNLVDQLIDDPNDRFRRSQRLTRMREQQQHDDGRYGHSEHRERDIRFGRDVSPMRIVGSARASHQVTRGLFGMPDHVKYDDNFQDRSNNRTLFDRIENDEADFRSDRRLHDRQQYADSNDRNDNRLFSENIRSHQSSQHDKLDASVRSDYRRFGDDKGSRNSSRNDSRECEPLCDDNNMEKVGADRVWIRGGNNNRGKVRVNRVWIRPQ